MRISICIYLLLFYGLLIPKCSHIDSRQFKVVTYNTHYMEKGTSGIVDVLHEMDAHIVALQEVIVKNGIPSSASIAKKLGYFHVVSAPYVSKGDSQWVLAFLSKYPIQKVDEIKLGSSRRALKILCKIAGENVTLVTLHLTPISGNIPSRENIKERTESRKREIRELLSWVGLSKERVVLLGDFNMLRGTMGLYGMKEYSLILQADYEDADGWIFPNNQDTFPLIESTREKIAGTVGKLFVPRSITLDYIFVGEKIQVVETEVIHNDASDHWPLKAVLRLK